jgi:YhcH/YjgK/YiaL family protein
MAIFGSAQTVRAQTPQTPAFGAAWTYIGELLRSGSPAHRRVMALGPGASEKVELSHGVFAIEQAYETKRRSEGFFESHRKYIDIQVVVSGNEAMEVVDAARIVVREPYQEERDLITYEDVVAPAMLRIQSGEAAVFYPSDVHMPSLRVADGAVLVRKAVLKVPVSA